MTLAEKMIAYRAKHNLSQTEFAKLVGVCYVTICRVENDSVCSKMTKAKIERVLSEGE